MNKFIKIGGRKIGRNYPPFVIAEISANHNGSIEDAKTLINLAKKSGADAVKIQTYRPDTITLNSRLPDFMISEGLWAGKSLFELYEQAHTPWEWHEELFDHARINEIILFSTPFDLSSVDLLESFSSPAYKIASFEIADLRLISYVARAGKPMIISTGMASKDEISDAVNAAAKGGCKEIALLHCVSGYPTPHIDFNLKTIEDLEATFGCVVGLSDHCLSNVPAFTSVGLGSSIIEKHFTIDRSRGGADDSFSLQPDDLCELCSGIRMAWESLGIVDYGLKTSEQQNIKFRRSLYFVRDVKAGNIITPDDIRSIRPGYGISPKFYEFIIGKRIKKSVNQFQPVTFDLISGINDE